MDLTPTHFQPAISKILKREGWRVGRFNPLGSEVKFITEIPGAALENLALMFIWIRKNEIDITDWVLLDAFFVLFECVLCMWVL